MADVLISSVSGLSMSAKMPRSGKQLDLARAISETGISFMSAWQEFQSSLKIIIACCSLWP